MIQHQQLSSVLKQSVYLEPDLRIHNAAEERAVGQGKKSKVKCSHNLVIKLFSIHKD